jgi:ribosomal protein S18 acetylase RimI-like enzyme
MNLERGPLSDGDVESAAAAIASGEVFQRYGLDPARARDLLRRSTEQIVVARVADEVVGVALYRVDGPMPVPAYLRILAVHAEQRGQGIGLSLLRFVEEEAFGRGPNLFLCCVTSNDGARRFYERHGYERVGVLANLIADGIDEILYRKTLGPIRGYVPPTG